MGLWTLALSIATYYPEWGINQPSKRQPNKMVEHT